MWVESTGKVNQSQSCMRHKYQGINFRVAGGLVNLSVDVKVFLDEIHFRVLRGDCITFVCITHIFRAILLDSSKLVLLRPKSNKRYRVRQIYGNIISFQKWIYLISCYNCCCRYISFLNTSILHFRSLNYENNIISMVIDRETIVSLHRKGESNSTIAKVLQIRCKTVWKVVKKFRETCRTSNRPGQVRKRTVWTKRIAKNMREKLRTSPVFRRSN